VRAYFCAAIAALGCVSSAQDLNYAVYFAGAKAGTEVVHVTAAGSVTGNCSLKVGAIEISEKLSCLFSGGKLVSSDTISVGPGGTTQVRYASGKITSITSKQTQTVEYRPEGQFFGSNLIVSMWATSAKEALRQLRVPGALDASVSIYFPDVGRQVSIKFGRMPGRRCKLGEVSALKLNLPGVQAEIDTNSNGTVVGFDVPAQKIRFVLAGWEGLFEDPLAKYPELSQPTYQTMRLPRVAMRNRDGVELVATVVKPVNQGRFPVILARTPYGRETAAVDGEFYARRGYVYVAQDVRGRGDSKGEWDPFVHEGPDGYDAIQWASSQPWSSGEVGMIGGSYGGYVQWAAAVLQPLGLKCIVPQVSPPDAMHNLPYDFGVPFLYGDVWWGKVVLSQTVDARSLRAELLHPGGFSSLPLGKVDQAVLGVQIPFFRSWLSRTTIGDWKGFDFYQHLEGADVPALNISGWFDGDGIGTKMIWARNRQLGRQNQWLIEGPWEHAFNSTSTIGETDYGPSSVIDLDSLYLRWFDTWLKHKEVGIDTVPRAQIFLTGANKWLNLQNWPDASEKSERLYLGGERSLTEGVPSTSSDQYSYDPAKDGSKTVAPKMDSVGVPDLSKQPTGGFFLYKTAAYKLAKRILGPAVLDLFFSTDAVNTDFFVSVVDIDASGKLHAVGQPGKIRGSYLNGVDKVVPLTPGKVYEAKIQPWDFAHEFGVGHRLGVIVSSTLFPIYARNLGTVEPILTSTRMMVQHNRLLFGKDHPSSFQFDVLP
jgi:putative CocE/NonD family hydrolase